MAAPSVAGYRGGEFALTETGDRTLVDVLLDRAARTPDRVGYSFLRHNESAGPDDLTYGELAGRSAGIAAGLAGVSAPGDRILLPSVHGPEFVTAFLGCLLAARVPVPVAIPTAARRVSVSALAEIVEDCGAVAVAATSRAAGILQADFAAHPSLAGLAWLASDQPPDAPAPVLPLPPSPDDIAFLQYTSGSTGSPRAVMVRHGNLIHNLDVIRRAFGHTPSSRGIIWLPPHHDMGLIGGLLGPLFGGFPVVLMSPRMLLRDPLRWLDAISRYGGTTSGGPAFAYDHCLQRVTPEQAAGLDLSSWDIAFVGAEPINPGVLAAFAERFQASGFRADSFFPCYGLAESTLMVSGGPRQHGARSRRFSVEDLDRGEAREVAAGGREILSCGPMLGGSALIVAPDTGNRRPPGAVGEIWLTGPSVAHGYWRRPEETAATFQATVAGSSGSGVRYLRTGDLGCEVDGELYVVGRVKDLIIVRGRNIFPQDIERSIEDGHPHLRRGSCAVFSVDVDNEEKIVVLQELDRPDPTEPPGELDSSIRDVVSRGHAVGVHRVVFVGAGRIPKTTSGKVQRARARSMFLAQARAEGAGHGR